MPEKKTEKIYPLVYNKEHYTVMANDIVKGKQDMTVQEARIIRLVITQVVKEDKDLKTYTCNIQDLSQFLGVSSQNLYRDIRGICESLAQRIVKVGTNNPKDPWKIFSWFEFASYDGAGNITLKLSSSMAPYVLDLDKYFTQYQLENILSMGSFYAIRLYELLKCDEFKEGDFVEYSIEFLRQFFECETKYKKFVDFRINVIDKAIKGINEKSDIEVRQIEYIKKSRRFVGIRFWVGYNYFVDQERHPWKYLKLKNKQI